MKKTDKKYPEGHFVGIWMAIWIAIFTGVGISLSTENPGIIGIWPALGVSVGLAVGQGVENKYKKEGRIRPLTKEEKNKRKMLVAIGVVILAIGALLGLLIFLLII